MFLLPHWLQIKQNHLHEPLMRKVLTPMAIAASSSSRIAFIIRPYFDHTSWRIMPVASRANSPHQNRRCGCCGISFSPMAPLVICGLLMARILMINPKPRVIQG